MSEKKETEEKEPTYEEFMTKIRKDIEASKRRKIKKVIIIQRRFRGWLTRRHLKELHKAATAIQKYFRGYIARRDMMKLIAEKYYSQLDSFYNKNAVVIQRHWRGYWARKSFNYGKFKAWKHKINKANEEALNRLECFRQMELYKREEGLKEDSEPWIRYIAVKLHHLLSTETKPGIFASRKYGDIERLISSFKYKNFMTDLRRERLNTAIKDLLERKLTHLDQCNRRITEKRCNDVYKAKDTISKPKII